MPVEQQVTIIYAGYNGYLDDIEIGTIRRFEDEFHPFMAENYPDVMEKIRRTRDLSAEDETNLGKAITAFKAQFKP
jgi:F-type H+-transporting ATPase subunit alpha